MISHISSMESLSTRDSVTSCSLMLEELVLEVSSGQEIENRASRLFSEILKEDNPVYELVAKNYLEEDNPTNANKYFSLAQENSRFRDPKDIYITVLQVMANAAREGDWKMVFHLGYTDWSHGIHEVEGKSVSLQKLGVYKFQKDIAKDVLPGIYRGDIFDRALDILAENVQEKGEKEDILSGKSSKVSVLLRQLLVADMCIRALDTAMEKEDEGTSESLRKARMALVRIRDEERIPALQRAGECINKYSGVWEIGIAQKIQEYLNRNNIYHTIRPF